MLFGPSWLAVLPEELKSLFQVIGPYDGGIPAYESGEALFFVVPQVPGVLQQQETGLLEGRLFASAEVTHGAPPHLIHRPVEMLHQVKAVEENLGVGSVGLDRLEISPPHIETNHTDGGRASSAQLGEEPGQGFLCPILAHPEQG